MSRPRLGAIAGLIREGERNGHIGRLEGVEGLSGSAIIGTLQRLARYASETGAGGYLELGVFRGYSLLSVAHALRDAPVIGIDDFSQFDPDDSNREAVEKAIRQHGLSNVQLINMDYEDAFDRAEEVLNRRIAVYFVDGPHDYRSQLMCLLLALPSLAEGSVIIVDDSNYRHVRQANRDFLRTHPDFALLFEAYTPAHPHNLSRQALEQARAGWWNGVNILIHDPERIVPRHLPPTHRDRSLFLADHVIHGSRYAHDAVLGLHLVRALRDWADPRSLLRRMRLSRHFGPAHRGAYPLMNTFSESLPASRFHLPPDLDQRP